MMLSFTFGFVLSAKETVTLELLIISCKTGLLSTYINSTSILHIKYLGELTILINFLIPNKLPFNIIIIVKKRKVS